MNEEYEDRVYDVPFQGTLLAGQNLPGQAAQIRNADAPWFLTGITGGDLDGQGGRGAIRIMDYTGRAISTDHVGFESAMTPEQSSTPGSNNYLKWPQNTSVRFDLLETSGADPINFEIVFRGFKRYRKGEAPCL